MFQLRPYQEASVHGVRTSYVDGYRSPLLVLPTGGGKTVVFSHIAGSTSSRNKIVWILVHRIELLRQTSKKLSENGIRHGLVNPKYTPDITAMVQVASVQTIIKRLDKLPAPDLIIIDEAHHALAATWKRILETHPDAKVLGVTATPIRGDGSGLGVDAGGVFDDLVMGPQIQELIDLGYLVRPIIYAPREQLDFSKVKTVQGDYDKKESAAIVDRPKITGNAIEHYKKLCSGVPAVAFCQNINHAMNVADAFRREGYRAYYVDGGMDDESRTRILNGLGNGTVDVVASCDLISEGTDIPAIGCAILLRKTQSLGLYLQQVGRALRTSDGKNSAIILDHVGNVIMHGLPDEDRDWTLIGDKKKKRAGNDEADIRVLQCPTCYNIHAPRASCPMCGHTYEVKVEKNGPDEEDGELVEMTEEHRAHLKRARASEIGRARTFDELKAIEVARGYKDGWAKHLFNSRQKKSGIEPVAEPAPAVIPAPEPINTSGGIIYSEYAQRTAAPISIDQDDDELDDDYDLM